MNKSEIETLDYHSSLCKCPECKQGFKPPKLRCRGRKTIYPAGIDNDFGETFQPKSYLCPGCPDCEPVGCSDKPTEQPNQNAMIFEQANGSIKVTLELLEQLETKNTNEETQKHGCIWTLRGWHNNNLKHLQKAFE